MMPFAVELRFELYLEFAIDLLQQFRVVLNPQLESSGRNRLVHATGLSAGLPD
jgi:hypothetical protein